MSGEPIFMFDRSVLLAGFLAATMCGAACAPARARRSAPSPSPEQARTSQAAATPPTQPAADLFQTAVRPLLAQKCAPCHIPGGRMYERLPFDRPEVVSSHADGIRRRLKGEDLQALERWLATLPGKDASKVRS
jgi:hypothetical protein